MPVIANKTWTTLREVPLGGGFAPDPDWVLTNDHAAAAATGTYELPTFSIRARLMFALVFLDISGGVLLSDANTMLLAERVQLADDGVEEIALVRTHNLEVLGAGIDIAAGITADVSAYRLVSLAAPPIGAETMRLDAVLV